MSLITLILLALSVSADAFAVAVGMSISARSISKTDITKLSLVFGGFQWWMLLLWFYITGSFSLLLSDYDHWIVFWLLGYIGGKMAYEWLHDEEEGKIEKNSFGIQSLITLWLATSIDALAVGISLRISTDSILYPAIFIGCITGILTYTWAEFGKKWGTKIGKRAEIFGGIVLVWIWTKILIEHLFS